LVIAASILVLTKNGGQEIGALLQAVFSQTGARPKEVILVDSGSSDETVAIAQQFPVRIEHIPAEQFHHARTRNFAASLTTGEVIIFVSQDAIPESPTWLQSMLANFEDPSVGAVYGRQVPKPGCSAERQDLLETVYGEKRLVKDPTLANDLGYRFYHFSDANSAIRRTVWQSVRFPEDLPVFEDLGIAKRILDAGWKIVYEPEACVYHSHRHSTVGLFKRYFDIGFTLRHLKIWSAPGVGSSMLQDAKKMLRRKLSSSGANDRKSAAGGVYQDCAKSLGLILGLNERYLPVTLKRHLSAHRIYGDGTVHGPNNFSSARKR